LRFCPHF